MRVVRNYHLKARSSPHVLHDDPQLVAPHKACLVLRDIWTGTCAEYGYLLLNICDVVFTVLKIDLRKMLGRWAC